MVFRGPFFPVGSSLRGRSRRRPVSNYSGSRDSAGVTVLDEPSNAGFEISYQAAALPAEHHPILHLTPTG